MIYKLFNRIKSFKKNYYQKKKKEFVLILKLMSQSKRHKNSEF